MVIDSPFMDEIKEILRQRYVTDTSKKLIADTLEARFGSVPADRIAALSPITDEARLQAFHRLAVTCPDLDAFVKELATAK